MSKGRVDKKAKYQAHYEKLKRKKHEAELERQARRAWWRSPEGRERMKQKEYKRKGIDWVLKQRVEDEVRNLS